MSPSPMQQGAHGRLQNDLFLRGEPEGVFVVVWKKPPTIKALDEALGPMLARFKQSPEASQAFMVISLAREPASFEANRYAAGIAKTYAKQLKLLAMVEDVQPSRGVANRIALRMIVATAGVFGLGPTVGLFQSPREGVDWIAKKLRDLGTPVNAIALQRGVADLIERSRAEAER